MRLRLIIGTVLLTVATIAAFFVPAAVALASAERQAQVVELQREAADAAARYDPRSADPQLPPEDDYDGDDQFRRDARPTWNDREHIYAVYDAVGRRVSGSGPATADAPTATAIAGESATATVGDQRVAAVPLSNGGAVRTAESASEADDRARAAMARLALIAVCIVVAASGAAWLLARRLTAPLGALARTAARLGGGDFTATAQHAGLVEIDEVADALNTSGARIGAMVDRERRLTADTSHQLRTPIAGLRLALEAELEAPRADRNDVIHDALGAVDRLEATVVALANLARDSEPTEPVDLAELVQAAVLRWAPLVEGRDRTIEADVRGVAVSRVRRAAIETVLDVLVDNALAHGAGTVRVSLDRLAGAAQVVVTDEGSCRVPEDQLFARHASGSGSTGIGLHLARSLADAEGARLRLVVQDPTAFEVVFPLAN